MTESTNNKSEHVHDWWYQPPHLHGVRLFASRQERGHYWYCNVKDMGGCGAISYERPEGATNGPR